MGSRPRASQCRIVIPTVFRREYISALKDGSNTGDADALIAVMDFAQRWTTRSDFTNVTTALSDLFDGNASVEPEDAGEQGIRLQLPDRGRASQPPRAGAPQYGQFRPATPDDPGRSSLS